MRSFACFEERVRWRSQDVKVKVHSGMVNTCRYFHSSFVFFVGLLDLADSYCEERLKKLCENIIRKSISVDNVALLLAAAIKYNAKVGQ